MYKGGKVSIISEKNAFVVLAMRGGSYVPGAVVTAYSLRKYGTKHSLVCMVTYDVPEESRVLLRSVFDEVIEVEYITKKTKPMVSSRQNELYMAWISHSFTKWRCLGLTQYDKVILLDADILAVANCDELFSLSAPAGCFSNPWVLSSPKGKALDIYENPKHGDIIAPSKVMKALKTHGAFVEWGAVVLLKTSDDDLNSYIRMLESEEVFGADYRCISGIDEVSIAAYYARKKVNWTHIHQRYLAIPWKPDWVSSNIKAYHYHGRNPWEMSVKEWPDLALWWDCADKLIKENTALSEIFYPTTATRADYALALWKMSIDIRVIVEKAMPQDAVRLVSRWLTNRAAGIHHPLISDVKDVVDDAVNTPRKNDVKNPRSAPRNTPHKRYIPSDAVNTRVENLVALREGSVPRPAGAKFEYDETKITYGPHFTMPMTPRLRAFIDIHGIETACVVSMCYASLLIPFPILSEKIVTALKKHLGDNFKHFFTSPLTTLSDDYYSLYPDIDPGAKSLRDFSGDRCLFTPLTREITSAMTPPNAVIIGRKEVFTTTELYALEDDLYCNVALL